jgi:hypothetical protein
VVNPLPARCAALQAILANVSDPLAIQFINAELRASGCRVVGVG